MNKLHDSHVELFYDAMEERAFDEAAKQMTELENRWVDNGCSNAWEDDQYYEQIPY